MSASPLYAAVSVRVVSPSVREHKSECALPLCERVRVSASVPSLLSDGVRMSVHALLCVRVISDTLSCGRMRINGFLPLVSVRARVRIRVLAPLSE